MVAIMRKRAPGNSQNAARVPDTVDGDVTKADLQLRMDRARESISDTVGEIKEKVEERYESVRVAVAGILDWREQFQKDPITWSVGALCGGFALGYTLGRAQDGRTTEGGERSELTAFTESLVDELGNLARQLPTQTIDPKLKQLFGFGLSEMIIEMDRAGTAKPKTPSRPKLVGTGMSRRASKKLPRKRGR